MKGLSPKARDIALMVNELDHEDQVRLLCFTKLLIIARPSVTDRAIVMMKAALAPIGQSERRMRIDAVNA